MVLDDRGGDISEWAGFVSRVTYIQKVVCGVVIEPMCWKDYSRPNLGWQVDRWQVNWVDDGAGSSDLQTDARTLDMERRYIISTSTFTEERYRTSCASAPLVPIFQNTQWWHLEAFQDKPEKKYPFGTDIPRKEMLVDARSRSKFLLCATTTMCV